MIDNINGGGYNNNNGGGGYNLYSPRKSSI